MMLTALQFLACTFGLVLALAATILGLLALAIAIHTHIGRVLLRQVWQ